MSGKTKIEWTESSWNPITGCTKISSGCKNCYAATFAIRLKAMGNPRYKNAFDVTIHDDLLEKPLSWKKPQIIFVNSMSDLFHELVPDEIILKIFSTMNKADWHTFQILTKRPERMLELNNKIKWSKNIWMGVSIEDIDTISRVDILKQTDAYIKFVSAEPLLSSLVQLDIHGIDWLIVGGESGHYSRPINPLWVTELKEKCDESNVAFFFKQWGGFNKKKSGSKIDGVEYKSYPHKINIPEKETDLTARAKGE